MSGRASGPRRGHPAPAMFLAPSPLLVALALLGPLFPAPAGAGAPPPDSLSFETPGSTDSPPDWPVPPGTVFRDSALAHTGRYSARIQRDSTSLGEYSSIEKLLPVAFAGDTLELRGWLKLDGVRGTAGLWLREDARARPVHYVDMEERQLSGTSPWVEYRVALPLDRQARRVAFGALLVGEGTLHVDDLQLYLDGRPPAEAPPQVLGPDGVEVDHEFDAGSRLSIKSVTPVQVESLVLLAKVWGFVKYHHPRVVDGKLHWDYELFRALPPVLRAETNAAAAAALSDWLARAGEPAPCHPCARAPDSASLLPRIEWIRDRARLGPKLSGQLERVHANRPANPEQYYGMVDGTSRTEFGRELPYPEPPFPDAGFRLLSLFRYWNIVEYWSPYRDLVDGDWDRVLAEFIPRVVKAGDRDEYRLAMLEFATRLRDGHAGVFNAFETRPPRGTCRLPVAFRPVEGRYVIAAFGDSAKARASGFQLGDVVRTLDGASVDSLAASWEKYYGASTRASLLRQIGVALNKGPCGACRVAVERDGKRLEIAAARDSISRMNPYAGYAHDLPGPAFRLLSKDAAYVKLSEASQPEIPSYFERAAGTRCFVFDIRNYPKEFIPYELGRHLVDRPTPFARFTSGDPSNPGAFPWGEPRMLEPRAPRYGGRVIVLVDDSSVSRAEFTAMALRAVPGALVAGSTTGGVDGGIVFIPLPGGLQAAMTGSGVYYADKKPTEQIGIVPDLEVRPTIRGIGEGRDEVLEAALKRVLGRNVKVPIEP